MRLQSGTVAVVTGAAGGIGRGLAEALARRGCSVALVDRDEESLRECAVQLAGSGCQVSLHRVDVSSRQQAEALPQAVVAAHGAVHILINNAGVSAAGPFEELTLEDLEWTLQTNFWGAVYMCRAFLPHLRAAEEGHIVNVLSDFALIGFPTKSAYCASKFALRGFSEALRAELHGTSVQLTCVYPGPVGTAIARNGRTWDPQKAELEDRFLHERGIPVRTVAEAVLRGVERNASRVLIGKETWGIELATRLAPGWTAGLVARLRKRMSFL